MRQANDIPGVHICLALEISYLKVDSGKILAHWVRALASGAPECQAPFSDIIKVILPCIAIRGSGCRCGALRQRE